MTQHTPLFAHRPQTRLSSSPPYAKDGSDSSNWANGGCVTQPRRA